MFIFQHISIQKDLVHQKNIRTDFGPTEIAIVLVQMTTRSQGLLLNSVQVSI